mmetsp:Transcript_33278/g.102769  ORF Transcript_33278/g.102769 Transcript_33278/m.102769 type:complete len:200 (-) Transcript_33278:104-703(-)
MRSCAGLLLASKVVGYPLRRRRAFGRSDDCVDADACWAVASCSPDSVANDPSGGGGKCASRKPRLRSFHASAIPRSESSASSASGDSMGSKECQRRSDGCGTATSSPRTTKCSAGTSTKASSGTGCSQCGSEVSTSCARAMRPMHTQACHRSPRMKRMYRPTARSDPSTTTMPGFPYRNRPVRLSMLARVSMCSFFSPL